MAMGASYLKEAVVSARSLRRHHRDPILLFTDQYQHAVAEEIFDQVVPLARSGLLPHRPHRDKLVAMQRSPFRQTLFLDTDTFVARSLADAWELLERFDIAFAGDRGYVDHFPADTEVPDSFKEPNMGVVFFRASEGLDRLWQDSLDLYDQLAVSPDVGPLPSFTDQTPFRLALYRSSLRFTALTDEYNCRFANYGKLNGPVRVLHGRLPRARHNDRNLHWVARQLNATHVPRVFVAGRHWALMPSLLPIAHPYRAQPMPSLQRIEWMPLAVALRRWLGSLIRQALRWKSRGGS
jgi:hypothetical protein